MRVDKFLNSVNLTKRRAVAKDMVESDVVFINGVMVKPSKDVKIGDKLEIRFLDKIKKYSILKIPTTKTTPKSAQSEYVKELL